MPGGLDDSLGVHAGGTILSYFTSIIPMGKKKNEKKRKIKLIGKELPARFIRKQFFSPMRLRAALILRFVGYGESRLATVADHWFGTHIINNKKSTRQIYILNFDGLSTVHLNNFSIVVSVKSRMSYREFECFPPCFSVDCWLPNVNVFSSFRISFAFPVPFCRTGTATARRPFEHRAPALMNE